jgi:benzoylformate decarboxylase
LLLAGEEISRYGGRKQLIELAELLAAPVVGDYVSGHGHIDFPTAHPQFFGYFPGQKLFPMFFDVFFSAGGRMFSEYDYAAEPIIARDVKTIHLSIDPRRIARTYPVDIPILADSEQALKALLDCVKSQFSSKRGMENPERRKRIAKFREELDAARKKQLKEEWSSDPISTPRLMSELNAAMDPNAIVVTETITSDPIHAAYIDYYKGEPGRMQLVSQGGILGWGIGASCGAKLAAPDREVVLLSGDGSFQFGIQGLWTAARYDIPVLFVILNNRSYQSNRLGLVKRAGRAVATKKYIGSHIGDPEIDHVAIARGYGVEGSRVAKPDELQPALLQALQKVRGGKPYVLDVLIARRFQDADATWHEKFSVGQRK